MTCWIAWDSICREESMENLKQNRSQGPKMSSPELYKQKHCLQSRSIYFLFALVTPWVKDYIWCRAASRNWWVLNLKTLIHLPRSWGVHCSSDVPSSFRDTLGFTSVTATSKSRLCAAKGSSEEWAGKQLQVFMFQPQNPCHLVK